MNSNKLHMHLKLFQTEAYFCSFTCFQGHAQDGNGTFCLWECWYWVVCDLIAVCLQLSVKIVVEFSQRKRIIPPNIFNRPAPPAWCCCAAAAAWGGGGCGKGFCCLSAGTAGARGCGKYSCGWGTSPLCYCTLSFVPGQQKRECSGSPAFCTSCCHWAVSLEGFCCWLQVPDLALKAKAAPCS